MSRRWLIIHALRALLIVATIQAAGPEGAQAQFFYDPFLPPVGPSPAHYVGYVASQGIPLSEDGQPIVVEYDAQGQVVGTVNVQPGMLIKSTQEWNSWVSRWEQARTEYEDAGGSTLELTRVEYDAAGRKCLDAEANEVSVSAATALLPEIRSVLVVRADAGLPACEGYILATSPLSEPRLPLAANASVVVDGEWRSQQVSETGHYFALETGYFDADASGCPEQSGLPPTVRNVQAFINCPAGSVQGVYAPVHGAEIETTSQNSFITVVTSQTGYYQLPYMSYGNVDDWSGDWVSARLAFARPDPRLRTARFFSLRKRGAGRTVSFAVDTVYLQAHARLMNDPSSIVDLVDPDYQFEDFTQYAVDPGGARGQDQGLLVEISAQDLRETDIYLFRVADNKLIGERRGMSPNELSGIPPDLAQFPNATVYPGCLGGACLSFVLVTRGPALSGAGGVSENNAFLPFASRPADGQPGLEPEYPDSPIRTFLRPGDAVKLVAINRSTGYTGVALGKVHVGEGGLSVIASPDDASAELVIDMFPPNLRVRANRQYEVEYGATAGEERNYIVGFEGSALNTDQLIAIRTEWFAPDGSALPEGLPGLTGRLARVQMGELQAGGPTDAAGQALGQFSIEPGIKTSVVRLPEEGVEREHYYIHVDGAPLTSSVDFAGRAGISRPDFSVGQVCYYSAGDAQACFDRQADEPELQSRPGQFVPFKVPVYDKQFSEEQRAAFLEQDLEDPGPVYRWPYRPEMQFTVHELLVEDVYRVEDDGTQVSVIGDANPHFYSSSGTMNASIEYDLTAPLDDPLSPFNPTVDDIDGDGEREHRAFSWDFAGSSTSILPSTGTKLDFSVEDYVAENENLEADDYVALRLLQLGDDANILWEFVVEALIVEPAVEGHPLQDEVDDVFRVSVDDPAMPFTALLLGYERRSAKDPITIEWKVEPATFGVWQEPEEQTDNETGAFGNTLIVTETTPGAEADVVVTLISSDGVEARFRKLVVVPGAPSSVDVQTSGTASALEAGGIDVEVTVRDQFGNPVVDGTSVDINLKATSDTNADAVVTLISADDDDRTPYEAGTIDGIVRAKIEGAAFESTDELLVVSAGKLAPQEFPFEVLGFDVEWVSPPDVVLTGALQSVTAKVIDKSGQPVEGLEVTFLGDYAGFVDGNVETDSAGLARAKFSTGLVPRQGAQLVVRAGVGQSGKATHTYDVLPAPGNEGLNVRDALMVGDVAIDGVVTVERYDGTLIDVDYETSAEIEVNGDGGELLTVALGDLSDPNLEPVLALLMNDIETVESGFEAPDEVGLHPAAATLITPVLGTPLGDGRSYLFRKADAGVAGSSLVVPQSDVLERVDDVGFRLDFMPYDDEGTLLNVGNGTHTISYSVGAGVTYRLRTTDGTVVVTHSTAVIPSQWHTVAVRVKNGFIELEVDRVPVLAVPLTGTIDYAGGGDLVVGDGDFHGQLNSLKWYDWSAEPLVEFADGSTSRSVVLDASGVATLTLQSAGRLNALQPGAAIRMLRIAVDCGTARQYASLISTAGYAEVAGNMLDANLLTGAPPVDLSGWTAQGPKPADNAPSFAARIGLISVAHAQSGGESLADKAWGFVKGTVAFFIPYEEFFVVVRQLGYLAQRSDQFNPVELILAGLGVATVVPIAKPLKLVLKPLKLFIGNAQGRAFTRAFAGVLGRAIQLAKKGQLHRLRVLLPYVLIVGEMAADPEAREGLTVMLNAIRSSDDLWAWIDYFNLPADGWEGDGEPPLVGLGAPAGGEQAVLAPGLLRRMEGAFVGTAHAANPVAKLARMAGPILGRALKKAVQTAEDAGLLSDGMRAVVRALRNTSQKELRKHVQEVATMRTLVGLSRAGRKNVTEFFKGRTDARVKPVTLIAIVAFLTTEWGDFRDDKVREKITFLYTKAFVGIATRFQGQTEESVTLDAHGALFHLTQVAVAQAVHKASLGISPPIKALEAPRRVQLQSQRLGRVERVAYGRRLQRYIDIVLYTGEDSEKWVELKSKKSPESVSAAAADRKFRTWTVRKTSKSSDHRQFVADVAAAYGIDLVLPVDGQSVSVGRPRWLFQKFSVRTPSGKQHRGYNKQEFAEVEKRLRTQPKGSDWDRVRRGSFVGPYAGYANLTAIDNVSVSSSFLSAIGDAIYDALSAEAVQRLIEEASDEASEP